MQDFSVRIKQLRLERNLTQRQMAGIIGINERNYQSWESGRYHPSFRMMMAIVKNFGSESLDEKVHEQ